MNILVRTGSNWSTLMGVSQEGKQSNDIHIDTQNGRIRMCYPKFPKFLGQLPHKIQNNLKARLQRAAKDNVAVNSALSIWRKEKCETVGLEVNLEKQLQAWKENPTWDEQSPEIKVSIPKGSLSNLKVKLSVGLPPDAVYNIVTDPENKRVFKNIKEVISRKVLVDEGLRQVVDLEQAAEWKFLWWSGTISVHVLVDQNREDHSMKFKQVKSGFMEKFEGCWRVQPLFVDEKVCFPFKPKTWRDYHSCTGGKGRIGSKVTLEQLIQPAMIPPPPISWYLRGITTRTTEMLINDLLAETVRIRGELDSVKSSEIFDASHRTIGEREIDSINNIKERWALRRRNAKQFQRMKPIPK